MSATATLLITKLGIPVAKALAGLWIENKVGLAVAGSVVDILGNKISDEMARKRVAGQLEKLGQSISAKLEPAFLPIAGTGEAEALAEHLSKLVLRVAEIPRDLLKISIDTSHVAQRLAANDSQWQAIKEQFGTVGNKAYSDALGIIAGELLTSLHMLPNWETAAMLEALQRMEQISAMLERMDLPDRLFEERYRRALGEKCNVMELFGLPQMVSRNVGIRASTTLKLDQCYVSLSLSGASGGDSAGTILDRAGHSGRLRLMVTGEAGCGKTTLMRWISVRCAHRTVEKISTPPTERLSFNRQEQVRPLMDWRSRVPFLIRLRHIDEAGLPDFARWTVVEGQPLSPAPSGWADRVLREGRALLLIDGLDEYPEDRRPDLLRSLKAHLDLHPDNACLVTSRGAAVPPELDEYCPLESAQVMELTPDHRRQLIHFWFAALPEHLRTGAGDKIDAYPSALIREIEGRPALAQMAGNPLLCSMFCALKFGTDGELPGDIVKVCADFVDMLLHRRDKDGELKKEAAPEYAQLSTDDRTSIARQLAHSMVDAGLSEVSVERARQFIHHTVECLPPEGAYNLSVRPDRVLTAMLERSGLLQLAERNKVQFAHNSLKEYLAASHYAVNSQIERVVNELPKSPWDRVVQFMMGLNLSNGATAELLKQMLDVVEDTTQAADRRRAVAQLAMAASTGKGGIPAITRERLAKLCHPFLPPETAKEATLLAQMGDAILPFLSHADITGRVEQAAATARCLRLIGTRLAEGHLTQHYANNPNRDVAFEVVQCLDPTKCDGFWLWLGGRGFSDYDFYVIDEVPTSVAERIQTLPQKKCFEDISQLNLSGFYCIKDISSLALLPNLTTISLSHTAVDDVTALSTLINLTDLHLYNTPVSDVSAVKTLKNLTSLNLSSTLVSDVGPLAGLTNLTTLTLFNTPIKDVSALAALENLTSLDLSYTAVRDVSALVALKNLKTLILANTAVSDVSALAVLKNLTTLEASGTTLVDLSSLAMLTNLTSLYLYDNSSVEISALAALKNLTNLYLYNSVVSDITALAALTNLTELYLPNMAVSDIRPLASLKNLTSLSLHNTATKDISALETLTNLTTLYLSNAAVTDITVLSVLTNLKTLDLSNTAVKDVSVLAALADLKTLDLSGTAISDVNALAALTNLTHIDISNTAVSDISVLATLKDLVRLDVSKTLVSDVSAFKDNEKTRVIGK